MELVIASQNQHKIDEIKAKLPGFEIQSLTKELFPDELQEEGETLRDNAIQKAMQVYQKLGLDCFADDTGLEIEALGGEPGVYSARYAGAHKSSEANMDKVLLKLKDARNRNAQFKTVIALMWQGELQLFEGICKGTIAADRNGSGGFGYDPIFIPEGESRSFAEMSLEEKNAISHRARATEKLVEFLNKHRLP